MLHIVGHGEACPYHRADTEDYRRVFISVMDFKICDYPKADHYQDKNHSYTSDGLLASPTDRNRTFYALLSHTSYGIGFYRR